MIRTFIRLIGKNSERFQYTRDGVRYILENKYFKRPDALAFLDELFSLWVRLKFWNFNPKEDLFTSIEIQTSTYCNYNCKFCPNNKINRPQGKMSKALYVKVINELSDINFAGVIIPFLANEPFLDRRIFEFVEIAKTNCPNAHIRLATNASVLTEDDFHKIFEKGLDSLNINTYGKKDIIEKIYSWSFNEIEKLKLETGELLIHQNLCSRAFLNNMAGNIPNWPSRWRLPLRNFCTRPFFHMVVGFTGDVLLCCSDWKMKYPLGNVKDNSLIDIWCNERYRKIRSALWKLQREKLPLCSRCDYRGFDFGFEYLTKNKKR
jgi:radical SAM protein with 4Fe4S-binding SPASM domain